MPPVSPTVMAAVVAGCHPIVAVDLHPSRLALAGRHIRGIIEGDAAPGDLIPRLLTLWRAGRFPFHRLIATYPVDEINQAVDDVLSGKATKAVVIFPDADSSMTSRS